jgi:hypothetical protein
MRNLQNLNLSFCSGLNGTARVDGQPEASLPEWMGSLTGLQELKLYAWSGLTACPSA